MSLLSLVLEVLAYLYVKKGEGRQQLSVVQLAPEGIPTLLRATTRFDLAESASKEQSLNPPRSILWPR
jgi:hypothetical protein